MAWSIAVLIFSGLVVTFSRRVMIHSLTDIHTSHIRFPLSTLTAAFQREDTFGLGYSPDPFLWGQKGLGSRLRQTYPDSFLGRFDAGDAELELSQRLHWPSSSESEITITPTLCLSVISTQSISEEICRQHPRRYTQSSLGPRPKTNPSTDRFQYCTWGRVW